jgi:hypothetical protein
MGEAAGGRKTLGIFEILLFLIVALIVIPPDDLPQVMRAVGKVLRELRLASNTVMREISSAIGDDSPFNILPPRFDDPHPPTPATSPSPPPPAFLAPGPKSLPLDESALPLGSEPAGGAASPPQASVADTETAAELSAEHQSPAGYQHSAPPAPLSQAESPEPAERSVPPADKP